MQRRLREVRDWAKRKIDSRQEPPWAWYQYMKLVETCDAILAGKGAVTQQTESSPQLEQHQENVIQLAGSTPRQGAARRRPVADPVQLPM